MPSNPFDDLPPVSVLPTPQVFAAAKANAFDDLTPPAKAPPTPATAGDRLQAAEGGFLKGTAYLATALPDTAANAVNLLKAGAGTAVGLASRRTTELPSQTSGGLYHFIAPDGVEHFSRNPAPPGSHPVTQTSTNIPSALQQNSGASPVGAALTHLLDKSPITTTQPTRPDDAVSRYLSTAASVVPGVLTGGGSVGQVAANTARAAVPAMTGQAVGEAHPFQSDWANNAASIAAQLGTALVMPRGRGEPLPQNQKLNEDVQQGQAVGYKFPPATTNPSAGNKIVETVAGKVSTQQHASIANQGVTNEGFRADLELPESTGPVTALEISQAKANAAPGYDALRGAGTISVPETYATQLANALSKNTGASRLAPSLGDSKLQSIIGELKETKSFDAGDAMDTMALLRDKAGEAFRSGNSNSGKAYRAASSAIESAIDQDLSKRGGPAASMLQDYRDSRRQFAQIATYEDAMDPSGNVNAVKLAKALADSAPLSGRALIAAQAASHAPKAFAVPTSSPVNHLGFWGSLGAGALAAHEYLPEHLGVGAAIGAAAIPASRWAARRFALGLGQANALPTSRPPIAPGVVAGTYTGLQGRTP